MFNKKRKKKKKKAIEARCFLVDVFLEHITAGFRDIQLQFPLKLFSFGVAAI